ncbi:MAG: hypothetical protein ACREFP_19825 [Acetobacteraceae bacterium]
MGAKPTVSGDLEAERRRLFAGALDVLAEKLLRDERELGMEFPYVTAPDGKWRTLPAGLSGGYGPEGWSHGNWFCGFWVGLLLIAYLHTHDDRFRALALDRLRLVAPRADDPRTHDIGFIFQASAVPAARITGENWCRALGLRAAERLRRRTVNSRNGAYIPAWGALEDPRGRRSSAIDTMANLELLLWAAEETGDGSFRLVAQAHANTTRRSFVRADFSTWHAVEYALPDGTPERRFTFQGYSDDSCWSRGQAWAMRGFAAVAAASGWEEDAELAQALSDYFLRRLPPDHIPYWDFDDPAIPGAPRDSSAAAIAAGALLTLAGMYADTETAQRYRASALALLETLCREYLAGHDHRGLLLHACYSLPHREGIDSATLFGDFYFAEALARVLTPGSFCP